MDHNPKPVPGFSKYLANTNGDIYDTRKEKKLKTSLDMYGDPASSMFSDQKNLTIRIKAKNIIAITHINIPEHLKHLPEDYLKIKHLDGDPTNISVANLCYTHPEEMDDITLITPYKTARINELEKKGYRVIPGYEKYVINKKGNKIINIYHNTILKPSYKHSKRAKVSLCIQGKQRSRGCSWLVAHAWLDLPKEFIGDANLAFNHKDGNIRNNHMDNLEVIIPKPKKLIEELTRQQLHSLGYKTIKENNRYLVNKKGDVWDATKAKLVIPTVVDIPTVSFFNGYKERRVFRTVKSLVIKYFSTIPDYLKDLPFKELRIKNIDGDMYNNHIDNLCYYHPSEWLMEESTSEFKKRSLKYFIDKGFKPIKGYENYVINKKGDEIYSLARRALLTYITAKDGTKTILLRKYNVDPRYHKVHVLVAVTWSTKTIEGHGNIIVFKDGNRNNAHINNLRIKKMPLVKSHVDMIRI